MVVVAAKKKCKFSDFNVLYLVESVGKEIIEFYCGINIEKTRMVAMVRKALI